MAKTYDYSRNFSDQENTVTTVGKSDLLFISRKTVVNGDVTYATYLPTLLDLAKVTELNFITNKLAGKLSYGEGLTGNGTEENPLRISNTWFNNNYITAEGWPFSQVGEMAEETIPLSGTYFSVSFPYNTSHPNRPIPMYLEGNGDLRMLRAVTNGEQSTYVYSLWKNYRNTKSDTIVNTDTVYRPTGLAANEFINHAFTASESAMVVEIATRNADGSSAFKEYGIVILNSTLIGRFHTIRRLGATSVIETLFGSGLNQSTYRTLLRRGNLAAVIIGGRLFIGNMAPSTQTQLVGNSEYPNAIKFTVAEVTANNTLALIDNWNVTNNYGDSVSTTTGYGVWMRNGFYENNVNAIGSYFKPLPTADGSIIKVVGYNNSAHTDSRWSWAGVDGDDIVVVYSHTLDGYYKNAFWSRNTMAGLFKLNPITGRVTPYDASLGKPWEIKESTATTANADMMNGYASRWVAFSSTAISTIGTVLPDGSRVAYRSSAETTFDNTLHFHNIAAGKSVTTFADAADDSNFTTSRTDIDLLVTPPSALKSNYLAVILHDRLIAVNAKYRDLWSNSTELDMYADLQGNANAVTYNILSSSDETVTVPVPGYALNNSRGYLAKNRHLFCLTSVTDGNSIYYHNAIWSSYDKTSFGDRYYGIGRDMTGGLKYQLNRSIYDKVDSLCKQIPYQSGYISHEANYIWYLTPIYPGIGHDKAFVEFHRVEFKDNGGAASTYGDYFVYRKLCKITQTKDSSGNYTITDIDFDISDITSQKLYGDMTNLSVDANNYTGYSCTAVSIEPDGEYVLLSRNGVAYRQKTGTWFSRMPTFSRYNSAGVATAMRYNITSYLCPTIDPSTKKLGLIGMAGSGGMYGFMTFNYTTGALNSEYIQVYSSPRPPAGFTVTVSAPISCYIGGTTYDINEQVIDLTNVTSSPGDKTFYVYAEVINDTARLLISLDKIAEHIQLVYIGYIKTTATEIAEINCPPITRWEVARPSTNAIGSAFAVSEGHPNEKNTAVWSSAQYSAGAAEEFLWEPKDIVDADDAVMYDVYFAHDPKGLFRAGSLVYDAPFYLIAKCRGNLNKAYAYLVADDVDISTVREGLVNGETNFEEQFSYDETSNIGTVSRRFVIDLPVQPGFELMKWIDMTAQRAYDVLYKNDEPYTLLITVSCYASETTSGGITGYVNGLPLGIVSSYRAKSGSYETRDTMTFVIPPGATYIVKSAPGAGDMQWAELRKVWIGI